METRTEPSSSGSGLLCNCDLLALERYRAATWDLLIGAVQAAEDAAPRAEGLLHRIRRRADDHDLGTARMESASGRRLDEVGWCAGDRVELGRVQRDGRAEELSGVGMSRLGEDVPGIAFLDDLARV